MVSVRHVGRKVVASPKVFFGISTTLVFFQYFIEHSKHNCGCVVSTVDVIDSARMSLGPSALPYSTLSPTLSSSSLVKDFDAAGVACLSHSSVPLGKRYYNTQLVS